MYLLETVAVFISLLMMAIVAINAGIVQVKIQPVIIKIALWAMAVLFILNTIGNLNAVNQFEKNVFAPTTFLLSLLCLMLILTNKTKN